MEFLNPFAQPIKKRSSHASLSDEPILSPLSSLPLHAPRGSGSCPPTSGSEPIVADTETTQAVVARMTTEQRVILENRFAESRNPSVEEYRALAEATGLSIQNVVAWFKDRCQKTPRQHDELLEGITPGSAGRFRNAVPSNSFISPLALSTRQLDTTMFAAPLPPRRISRPSDMLDHSTALARSLAKVAASDEDDFREPGLPKFQLNREQSFTDTLDAPQSPFPTSAFSDYGSSECSSAAYTPSEAEADDPFEFDNDSRRPSVAYGSNDRPPRDLPEPPPDNFGLFAAAIEMNSLNYKFVLPSFPPTRLLERRPNRFGSDGALQSRPEPATFSQDPFEASFSLSLATSKSQPEVPHSDPMENTIAARRRRPDTNSVRSNSFVCVPPSKQASRPAPTLRRINTDDANLGRISRSPPSPHRADNTLEMYATCPDTSVTIRPRPRAGTGSSESSLSGPLTPISPPSPEDHVVHISPPSNPQPESTSQQKQTPATHGQMSPPDTPPAATMDMRALLDSIPRQFSDGADIFDIWFASHGNDDDTSDMFLYDTGFYAISPQQQNPLMTTASIASSTTIGGSFF